jgi:tRNA-splicing endonuclease subunit Sen54
MPRLDCRSSHVIDCSHLADSSFHNLLIRFSHSRLPTARWHRLNPPCSVLLTELSPLPSTIQRPLTFPPIIMADADEDASNQGPQTHDRDLSEETQDFRFLNSIVNAPSLAESASIPKRGEKDFEPNATNSQAAALDASLHAMHTALSYPRLHQPKTHVMAQYCPEEARYRGACVRVDNVHGPHFRTMGKGDSRNRIWLLPEEALYLIERGSLDIRWPDRWEMDDQGGDEVDGDDAGDDPIGELPMSLQGAYASFIGMSGLTLERYQVFSGLRRLGYTVVRAPTWDASYTGMNGHGAALADSGQLAKTEKQDDDRQQQQASGTGILGLIHRLVRYLFAPSSDSNRKACPSFGPLVAPGLYRSYNDIYRALTLIPFETGRSPSYTLDLQAAPISAPISAPRPPFRVTYHVWKPSTAYRKSNPPPPEFRVAVLDARETSVPTISEIGTLLDSMPDDELPREKPLEARLKHGKRNVILAVVDMGVVSYLRFSEAAFGGEKLFENKSKKRQWRKGGHRGGGGGSRGGMNNA